MTNEEIIKEYGKPENWISLSDLLDLARADEREKMTEDKFAEYFNTLKGGEVASAILTQLLRKGITDDDLRGLRLQWIKEQPEGVDVWVSWDNGLSSNPCISNQEPILNTHLGLFGYNYTGNGMVVTEIFESFATMLGIEQGQCKKFRIVEVVSE